MGRVSCEGCAACARAFDWKEYDGGSCLRPSGCLPPTLDGSEYWAGPGEPVPARIVSVCFCEMKTFFWSSRVDVPKP